MKRRWVRLCCAFFALILALPPLGVSAAEIVEEQTAPADFVLLLDCSGSMGKEHDKEGLCIKACKNFIDKLPAQDARVSVIAFGFAGGEPFTYTSRFVLEKMGDEQAIHVIVPLGTMESVEEKDSYKLKTEETVVSNWTNSNTWTPVGHAVAAGVDMLEQSGSADENACLILISDGVASSHSLDTQDLRLAREASEIAGEHGWPIYCIELGYTNSSERKNAHKLMDEICVNSGNKVVGVNSCLNPKDVHVAFMRIFDDFYGREPIAPDEIRLPGEYSFNVPVLASEVSVDIFGPSVDYVELENVADGTILKISDSFESDNLIAVVDKNSYYSIKLICPPAGEWKVHMYGNDAVEVLVSCSTLQEYGLRMLANTTSAAEILTKNDTISVDAFLEYREKEAHNNEFYLKAPASLMVYCANGTTKEYAMQATKDGYHLDLPVKEIPSGEFTLQAIVTHTMFRNGQKASNAVTFVSENLSLQLQGPQEIRLSQHLNSSFENLDLSKLFLNPDGDPISYTLNCVSDRSVVFQYQVDQEADYMKIDSGLVPGEFQMEIEAKDPDMEEALRYPLTLEVYNSAPEGTPLPDMQVWLDSYSFQDLGNQNDSLDLDMYFIDPDEVGIDYQVSVSDESIVSFTKDGNVIHLTPNAEGETEIRIVASDGFAEISDEIKVYVVSGKAVYWRENWIYYAAAAAAVLLAIFIVIFIEKNTRVKGTWRVIFEKNYEIVDSGSINIGSTLRCARKKVFALKDMIQEILPFMDKSQVITHMSNPSYLDLIEKIEIKGVFAGSGFIIKKIPRSENVTVEFIGRKAEKRVRVQNGSVRIILKTPGVYGTEMIIITIESA